MPFKLKSETTLWVIEHLEKGICPRCKKESIQISTYDRYGEPTSYICHSCNMIYNIDIIRKNLENNSPRGKLEEPSGEEAHFWNLFPLLLVDDPENAYNELISILRETAENYFKQKKEKI